MRNGWQRRIERAITLAGAHEATRSLLTAYAALLELQRDAARALTAGPRPLTGSIDADLPALRAPVSAMLRAVAAAGSPQIARDARRVIDGGEAAIDAMLVDGWRQPSGHAFLPKFVLQPYAEQLAAAKARPIDRAGPGGSASCPFCGGAPQLAILESAGGLDGGGRRLLCALCFTTWPFRRVLCAHCGEEEERALGYFQSPAFEHVRVDGCETCRHYVKTVDLTRLGLAVPLVDEIAAGALDVWAADRGYTKIELNLVGL